MKPVPVLYLMDHANLGGVQTCLINLLQAFDDPRYKLHVAALYGPGPISDRFADIGYPIHYLGEHKKDLGIAHALKLLVAEHEIEIVHAYGVPSCALCEFLRGYLRIPKLITHVQSTYRMHHSRPYQNLVEPLIYRRANHLAACSQTVLNPIQRRIPRSVIYNGVDFDALQAPLPEAMRAELRQQQGIQPDDYLIGVTGRIFAGKDPLTVCRAAVRMAEAGRSFRILFLGTGPMRDDVMQFSTEAGLEKLIILAGYQSNIRDWLHVLDAFAFPSLAEGLPMALIEAMAVGLPCVVSDFPAASEVITPGRDALQFKRGDDATLATLLMRLQDDPVLGQQLGQTARATVQEKFTAKEMARQTAALYDQLMTR